MSGAGSSGGWHRRQWPSLRLTTRRWRRRGAPIWLPCSCLGRTGAASGGVVSLGTASPWCGVARPRIGFVDPAPRPSWSRHWPGWRLGAGGFLGRPFGVALTWLRMGRRLPGSFGRLVCGGVALWSGIGGSVGMTRLLLARMAGRGADALHAVCLSVAPWPCILWLHFTCLTRLQLWVCWFLLLSTHVMAGGGCLAQHGTARHRTPPYLLSGRLQWRTLRRPWPLSRPSSFAGEPRKTGSAGSALSSKIGRAHV